MALTHLKIERIDIPLDGKQSFPVRALSAVDVMVIVAKYGPQCATAFGMVMSSRQDGGPITRAVITQALMTVLPEFPNLFGALIALASDQMTDEAIEIAKNLPMTVQANALETIFSLTFKSETELEKFMESLTRMTEAVSAALTGVRTQLGTSPTGTPASAVN